jgi:hypothetical protein
MASAEVARIDAGMLAANGMMVQMLQTTLSQSETSANTLPKLLRQIVTKNAWREFAFPGEVGQAYRWNAADFRRFLESPRPAGCETPIALVRRMVVGTDVERAFEELIRGEPGNPTGRPGAPRGEDGAFTSNRNNITDTGDDPPITIPIDPAVTRERDYSRESQQGTSTSYALRRLQRNRPDLHAQVLAKELTPNAAMIAAGFRDRTLTIPINPTLAGKRLALHYTPDQFNDLCVAFLDAVGVRQPDKE